MGSEEAALVGLIHFSDVTNKIHHCLRFLCGSRHLVPVLVSQTRVLVLVLHTSLVSHTNITLVCDILMRGQDGGSHMENVNNDEFYL